MGICVGVLVADGGKTSDAFLAGTQSAPSDSINPKCSAFRIISASPAKQLGNKAVRFRSSACLVIDCLMKHTFVGRPKEEGML